MRRLRSVLQVVVVVLPWALKRTVLQRLWGYDLHPTASIGLSWVFPERLTMGEGARIGHLNVVVHLDRLTCGAHSIIGRSNWIAGHPASGPFFAHREGRRSELDLGAHAAIVKEHVVDCSDHVHIGAYTVVGGWRTQILTHGISLESGIQDCAPVWIGEYCLVGTGSIVLGGSRLPDRSSLGAGAVLRHAYDEPLGLFAGVPARRVRELDPGAGFFHRVS